ncbi:MAG: GNAT family N-acetyltransferase [Solirubrobacteraceae bacterium]
MDEATIRPARAEDADALRALERATWSWEVSPAPPRPAEAPFYDAAADTLVAERGGALVGYARLVPVSPLASSRHVLELHCFAFDPAHRRRGIGRRLVEAAVAEARRRGARRLCLRVLAPNAAARGLYAAAGFAEEGVLRGEFLLDGEYVDDVLMAIDLSR